MNQLTKLLFFEASSQTWMKKFGIDQEKAEEFSKDFEKNKASIWQKDITKYKSFKDIANVITTVSFARYTYNLKSNVLLWLTKIMFENPNIKTKEDYFPALVQYQKNKNILPPIESFKDINELIKTLQSTKQSQFSDVTPEQEDKFYSIDGWNVYMPHTTQASCKLGQGTTWCTARTDRKTEGENYYLQYVTDAGYVLFYVIRQNPSNDPWDKLSIGYNVQDEEFEWGTDGHVTVNADNIGLTYEKLEELMGEETASKLYNVLKTKAANITEHPAHQEYNFIAQDLEKFKKHFGDFSDVELTSIKKFVSKQRSFLSSDVAFYIIQNLGNAQNYYEAEVEIEKIQFSNKVFSYINGKHLALHNCVFVDCLFENSTVPRTYECSFTNCSFEKESKISFTRGSVMTNCKFNQISTFGIAESDIKNSVFINCTFNNDFNNSTFSQTKFDNVLVGRIYYSNFIDCSFSTANFNSKISLTAFKNTNFNKINLTLELDKVVCDHCFFQNSEIFPVKNTAKLKFINQTTIDKETFNSIAQLWATETDQNISAFNDDWKKFKEAQPELVVLQENRIHLFPLIFIP